MTTTSMVRTVRAWVLPMAIGCLIGAAAIHAVHAQAPGIKRTPLYKADLTGLEGKEVIMTLVEAQPGADFAAHTHPGDEFLYVIEGTLEGFVEKTTSATNAGGTFHAQREKVHGGKVTGTAPARLLTVHVVDKGKPLVTPAARP